MRLISAACCLVIAAATGAPAQAQSSAGKADLAALQGAWTIVSATSDGQSAPPDAIKDSRRTAHGDTTTVVIGGRLMLKATFVLNPTAKPKTIDYHVLDGMSPTGSTQMGIYELKGDTARFCFAPPGQPRPGQFATHLGERRTCSVWQRAKP